MQCSVIMVYRGIACPAGPEDGTTGKPRPSLISIWFGWFDDWVQDHIRALFCRVLDRRGDRKLGVGRYASWRPPAKLMGCLDSATGQPFPLVREDWANIKAVYRFLSNDAVTEKQILAGLFQETTRRATSCDGTLLVL